MGKHKHKWEYLGTFSHWCEVVMSYCKKCADLQAENDRLKAELADSLPLGKVREAHKLCNAQIESWEMFDAFDCQDCKHVNICSIFGDAYLWEIKKLEKYVKEVRGEISRQILKQC